MIRRYAAVGAPPLFLILVTLLLVHYQPLILDTLWGGRLPDAWRGMIFHLPLVLAATGVVIGLRMGSAGVVMIMLTAGVVTDGLNPGGFFNYPLAGNQRAMPTVWVWLLPVNYLLGRWCLGHSWRSRRGLIALAGGLFWTGWVYAVGCTGRGEAILKRAFGWAETLPVDLSAMLALWDGALPPLSVALYLMARAIRRHDPVCAGLGASLVMLLPPVVRSLNGLSLAIVAAAAVLVMLVGILESMFDRAYRDGLTGLPGRRALNDMLPQLGRRFAIAMLDVDHFKRFNDRYGHRTGDDVLKMIAARMQRISGGRAFRYGGEEFAVIFRGRAARRAADRMEAFREALAQTPFVIRRVPRTSKKRRGSRTARTSSRQQVKITVSIGLALPQKGRKKPSDVLAAADKALYKAKKAGRNRVAA